MDKIDKFELKQRIDTIYSVVNLAMISQQRYIKILNDKNIFSLVFPNVEFSNLKIHHIIDDEIVFSTTKNEIVSDHNYNLYKAWQIWLGLVGMTSIFEYYLIFLAENYKKKSFNQTGIFYRFEDWTGIRLSSFERYNEIRKYYEVRNISLHNLGRINDKFNKKTGSKNTLQSYVYFPKDLMIYRDLIFEIVEYIDNQFSSQVTTAHA